MGLISHAVALGLGYTLGGPDGRRRLGRLGRHAGALIRPEVAKLRERGWDIAGEQVLAARSLATRRSRRADLAAFLAEDDPARPFATPTGRHRSTRSTRDRPAAS